MSNFTKSTLVVLFMFFANLVFAQGVTTIQSGSYIINMGSTSATFDNTSKGYGLVYQMLRNKVPVYWVINQSKGFDGTDFTYNSVDYKGGTFIIPGEFIYPGYSNTDYQ